MSETVLKVLIGELDLIRLVCAQCGTALELPIEKLNGEGKVMQLACPVGCGQYRIPASHHSDPLARFTDAVRDLKKLEGCRIEFVLSSKVAQSKP